MTPREEESLLDEMRASIRAHRERSASRQAASAAPPPEPAPKPEEPRTTRPLLRRLLGR